MKKNLLIIIPARSGSKRVKNKNMKLLAGKPLLFHKIKSCLKVKNATVLVSTDSKKIASFAKNNGAYVPFLRVKKYSTSKASTSSVILETLRKLLEINFKIPNYIAVLPATNPFLKESNIVKAFNIIKNKKNFNSIIGLSKANVHPFNFVDYKDKKYSQFERTQDWPLALVGSAALKITKSSFFLKKIRNTSPLLQMKTFDMNSCTGIRLSTLENFDINNSQDFIIADILLKKNKIFL